MQLDQILNLGLVSWALVPVTPFWACGFSLITVTLRERERRVREREESKTQKSNLWMGEWAIVGTSGGKMVEKAQAFWWEQVGDRKGMKVSRADFIMSSGALQPNIKKC